MSSDIKETLKLLNNFFLINNVNYWLEAGTALGAYRDGEIMSWDHDMDIAIWFNERPSIETFNDYFIPLGFDVIVQKGFPFIDNIIQLRVNTTNLRYMDVDIYLYKEDDEYAYMRWINSPVGSLSGLKQKLLYYLAALYKNNNFMWSLARKILSEKFCRYAFKKYLQIHINTSECIYHRFPKIFFKELKEINFYDTRVKVASKTEEYLAYRYGEGWSVKDKTFNQTGKWKASQARVRLKMNHLPLPKIDTY
tara:strand:- start:8099 stop:8851 length:753 start_codon:yes stop_codon:yes gene_type:complete